MSTSQRAYDILRGYVNREWDRLRGIDWEGAWKELDSWPAKPKSGESGAGERELERSSSSPSIELTPEQEQQLARSILAVGPEAGFDAIRKAYERMNKRSDPTNFPEGSNERNEAVEIHKRVNWAYRKLTEGMAETEKRFRSLEID